MSTDVDLSRVRAQIELARSDIAWARRRFSDALEGFHRAVRAGHEAGLTYRELAEAAGVSKMQAWRICNEPESD